MLRSDLLTHYGEQVTAPTGKELLDRFAAVLVGLGARHGLSNLRHGGAGTVVADVEAGRTYSIWRGVSLRLSHCWEPVSPW
jgi:hypothetical protein